MKRVAVIGCGVRSEIYMHQLQSKLENKYELAAIADPSPTAIKIFKELFGKNSTKIFTSGSELLSVMGDEIDGVIIGSPNAFHSESLIPAIGKKIAILLEKPVATSLKDCRRIWESYITDPEQLIAVGFVLRYTPFYSKIKEIVDSHQIGKVLSIEASEWLGPTLTYLFKREWRRFEKFAGPMIVEKCSHDMDILNWLADSKVRKVSSFATQTRFTPDAKAAEYCHVCKLFDDCRYNAYKMAPFTAGNKLVTKMRKDDGAINDLCVFNSEKDTPDQQVVIIEYENGVLANFCLSTDQPESGRSIRINGTDGQLYGSLKDDTITIKYHKKDANGKNIVEEIRVEHDKSGHSGGDSILGEYFEAMLNDDPVEVRAGLKEGIDACLIGFAAEISRHEGRIVEMREMYDEVYKITSKDKLIEGKNKYHEI